MIKYLLIILILLNTTFANAATLEFESGFDSATTMNESSSGWSRMWMTGTDATTGDDWETDIQAISEMSATAQFLGTYNGTWGTNSEGDITTDPEDAENNVLRFRHIDEIESNNSRLSLSFHYNHSTETGFTEGYIKYKMRYSDLTVFEDWSAEIDWFVIMEQFYHSSTDVQEFRWNLSIHKPSGIGESLFWRLKGQNYTANVQGAEVWFETNTETPIPTEAWFLFEVYCKKGDENNGRIIIWITPDGGSRTELFNITDLVEDPNNATYYADDWQVLKIYTLHDNVEYAVNAGEPIEAWYDDFEYWDTYEFSKVSIKAGNTGQIKSGTTGSFGN